jgi:hypothetical protein
MAGGIRFGNKKPATGSAAPAAGKGKAASNNGAKGASLLPEEWVSGGLLNDVDVDITDMSFVDDWTYNGQVETPPLALRVTMTDEAGAETIQYLSAGDLTRFVPSEDGKRAVPAEGSTATALNNNTNCAAFLASIMEQGFPKKLVSDRVDVFEGCNVHVNRVPQKKRAGLATDGKEREVLIVTKINSLPGEKATTAAAASRPKGVKAATASPKKAAGSASDTESEAPEIDVELATAVVETVLAVLEEKDGKAVPFKTLSLAALKHLAGNPDKAAISAILKNPEQLAAVAEALGDFETDGETVTAA